MRGLKKAKGGLETKTANGVLCDVDGFCQRVLWTRSQNCEKRLSAWNNSAPTGRILMKLDI
jgi:hypothetical protein